MIAYVIAESFAQPDTARSHSNKEYAVLAIDAPYHAQAYLGRYPLPREPLYNNLITVYRTAPKLIAIDLDLSPTPEMRSFPRGHEATWQRKITELLKENADRTILLEPFDIDDASTNGPKKVWMSELCDKGVVFGSGYLDTSFGVVFQHEHRRSDFSAVVARRITDTLGAVDTCKNPTVTPHGHRAEVRFGVLDTEITRLSFADQNLEKDLGTRKYVFIGAKFGEDDLHETPRGKLYGVDIHAAITASRVKAHQSPWLRAVAKIQPILGFALDVVIGVLFGMLAHWYWTRYFKNATTNRTRVAAHCSLFGLGFSYVVTLVGLLFLAGVLLRCGLWINPIPIALGMLIHGFAQTNVEVAVEELARENRTVLNDREPTHLTWCERVSSRYPQFGVSRVLGWLVVVAALVLVVREGFESV